jgi:hypothetical protein
MVKNLVIKKNTVVKTEKTVAVKNSGSKKKRVAVRKSKPFSTARCGKRR